MCGVVSGARCGGEWRALVPHLLLVPETRSASNDVKRHDGGWAMPRQACNRLAGIIMGLL
jgi:hypothetical protein